MTMITKVILAVLSSALLGGCASPVYSPPPAEPVVLTPKFPVFFVIGEVKHPGRQEYVGPMRLSQAIESAGGFADSANRRRLEIRRANGAVEHYNYNLILTERTDDPPVWPSDTVDVKGRRFVW